MACALGVNRLNTFLYSCKMLLSIFPLRFIFSGFVFVKTTQKVSVLKEIKRKHEQNTEILMLPLTHTETH